MVRQIFDFQRKLKKNNQKNFEENSKKVMINAFDGKTAKLYQNEQMLT